MYQSLFLFLLVSSSITHACLNDSNSTAAISSFEKLACGTALIMAVGDHHEKNLGNQIYLLSKEDDSKVLKFFRIIAESNENSSEKESAVKLFNNAAIVFEMFSKVKPEMVKDCTIRLAKETNNCKDLCGCGKQFAHSDKFEQFLTSSIK